MSPPVRVLLLGVSPQSVAQIKQIIRTMDATPCDTREEFYALLQNGRASDIQIIIAGPNFNGFARAELAQGLRMAFQNHRIYYLSESLRDYDRAELVKNGFNDAFILPLDNEEMAKVISAEVAKIEHQGYVPVRLVDIEAGTRLDFQISLYFKANNKFVTYITRGDAITEDRLQRLYDHNVTNVYIPADQLDAFYKYSAERLKELAQDDDGISPEVRQTRLRTSVRELVTGLLSSSYSRYTNRTANVTEHTRDIIQRYIMLNNPGEWYHRIVSEVGQLGDAYSHSGNVATFATLFAMILKIGKPEEIAIAGLFHDIGITLLPPELQTKDPVKMTTAERTLYQKHPILSLEAIHAKGLVLPQSTLTAIAQHHERWDGTGYPARADMRNYSAVGQVLAIADRFDYLTRLEKSVSPLSPDQAIQQIARELVASPDLIRELSLVFSNRPGVARQAG